jgi:hypothetical protein
MATREELRAIGQTPRQRLFGAPAPGAPGSLTQELAADLGGSATRCCSGRSGAARVSSCLITIAGPTTLGPEVEPRVHVRGGLNLGLSRQQIVEIIMQMAFYAGQPAAHAGFRAAKEVFDAIDKQTEQGQRGAR